MSALTPGFELVIDKPITSRGYRYMKALRAAYPRDDLRGALSYGGSRENLVVYGSGNPTRQAYIKRHLAQMGRVFLFDMAYFDRASSMRFSVNTQHPTKELLDLVGDRPARRQFHLRRDYDPSGPILLIGMGRKSNVQFGWRDFHWEHLALEDIRKRWPGKKVVWRPKGRPVPFEGLPLSSGATTPIEKALRECSMVYCRHSNVAVDACLQGVPVICEGGAAYTLYKDNPEPSLEERKDFLRKLSWFEWNIHDQLPLWNWMIYLGKNL